MINARAIGLMTMIDSGKKDHKIIAVATKDPEFNSYTEAAQMPPHRSLMLRRFFQDYKLLEGKAVEVDQIRPAAEAYPVISDALHRYSEQRRKGVHSHFDEPYSSPRTCHQSACSNCTSFSLPCWSYQLCQADASFATF